MAIIKCPECGNPVSDKAPFCPKCGVEIAGKIKPAATPPPPIPPTEKTDNPQSSNEKRTYYLSCDCFDCRWTNLLFLS